MGEHTNMIYRSARSVELKGLSKTRCPPRPLIKSFYRRMDWETTGVTIRLCNPNGSNRSSHKSDFPSKPATYARTGGARQSKRLRQNRQYEQRSFTVTKSTTVRDLKIMVNILTFFPCSTLTRSLHIGERTLFNSAVSATSFLSRKGT